jgi:hypothetical protein
VASALLSGSFWRIDLNNATKSRFIQLQEEGNTNEIVRKLRQQFGKVRVATARTNLQLLQAGKELAQLRLESSTMAGLAIQRTNRNDQ